MPRWCSSRRVVGAMVDPIVVKSAVAEYFTRNRRFGGVDG